MTAKESKAVAVVVDALDTGAIIPVWIGEQEEALCPLGTLLVPESALRAAEAELGELRRRVGELADSWSGVVKQMGGHSTPHTDAAVTVCITELRQLLASDGGADGACNHEWAEGYGVPAYCQHCGVAK